MASRCQCFNLYSLLHNTISLTEVESRRPFNLSSIRGWLTKLAWIRKLLLFVFNTWYIPPLNPTKLDIFSTIVTPWLMHVIQDIIFKLVSCCYIKTWWWRWMSTVLFVSGKCQTDVLCSLTGSKVIKMIVFFYCLMPTVI